MDAKKKKRIVLGLLVIGGLLAMVGLTVAVVTSNRKSSPTVTPPEPVPPVNLVPVPVPVPAT